MCGIVGLYLKNPALENQLGTLLADMLLEMTERGPDSAGVAIYRDAVDAGETKLTLQSTDEQCDWQAISEQMAKDLGCQVSVQQCDNHGVFSIADKAAAVQNWCDSMAESLRVTSIGEAIEIYKEKGLPEQIVDQFALRQMQGTHALGHTRMATESAVTTEHSHPFSTGLDLCLVHNGSLSNHNRLREQLRSHGVRFQTDNDSEVAAGYLTWRLSEGDTLEQALQSALVDLDGFYTFAIGSKDGFAVLRDPIACKPAVLAETDDWVAMASEYRAIDRLPGSANARIWEPEPATIYSWERD